MFTGSYCQAPAGLLVNCQSYFNNKSKKPLSNLVGCVVQAPSIPEVTVLPAAPLGIYPSKTLIF